MAFDLYADGRHEAIGEQDAYVFSLASQAPGDFPQLNALWARFYEVFNIDAEQAGALVHELLVLYARYGAHAGKGLAPLVLRLAHFFSTAHRTGTAIRCIGD